HGEQVRPVELQLRVELIGELVPGATGAVPERVPALDHEVGDDPVEDGPVVELPGRGAPGPWVRPLPAPLREVDEVAHRLGGVIGKKADQDGALVGEQRGSKPCGHGWHPRTARQWPAAAPFRGYWRSHGHPATTWPRGRKRRRWLSPPARGK